MPSALQVAHRRNEQKRHGPAFASAVAGVLGAAIELLPAEAAFAREAQLEAAWQAGGLRRVTGLTRAAAERLLADGLAARDGGEVLEVSLCHHPHLAFRAPLAPLLAAAFALAAFDRDSFCAAAPHAAWGFGLDLYPDERSGVERFTVDLW